MKDDNFFLEHILKSTELVLQYTRDISYEDFLNNREKMDAVVRNIEIIGEACKSISVETKNISPLIPWKDIVRARDIIAHHYFELDNEQIWKIITEDLPLLKTEVEKLLKD